jgi:hypothetical protein
LSSAETESHPIRCGATKWVEDLLLGCVHGDQRLIAG